MKNLVMINFSKPEKETDTMSDPQRFLRYVIPGLVYGVLTIVLVGIVLPEWTGNCLSSLKKDDVLPVLIAAVIGTGGVGYLLGELHHCWLWSCCPPSMDHTSFVKKLVEKGLIKFVDPSDVKGANLKVDGRYLEN